MFPYTLLRSQDKINLMPDINENPISNPKPTTYVIRKAGEVQAEQKQHMNELFEQLRKTQRYGHAYHKFRKSGFSDENNFSKRLSYHSKHTGANKGSDFGSRTRPKTAYRPMTSKFPNKMKDALIADKNIYKQPNPYVNTMQNGLGSKVINHRSRDTRAIFQSDASANITHNASMVYPARSIVTKKRSKTQLKDKIVDYSVRIID